MKLTKRLTMYSGLLATPLLALTLSAPMANAATAADPAPTGVTIAWADAAHTKIRVTWTEDTAVPNAIATENTGDAHPKYFTAADGPNQLDIPAGDFTLVEPGMTKERIMVFAGTEAGGTTSPAGYSAVFDTLAGPKPVLDSIAAAGTGKFTVKWHPGAVPSDPNPGDPLDLPAGPVQYSVGAGDGNNPFYPPLTPKSTATSATFTQPSAPTFGVAAMSVNEWG